MPIAANTPPSVKLASPAAGVIEALFVEEGWIVALDRNGLGGTFEQRIDFDPRLILELEIKQIV